METKTGNKIQMDFSVMGPTIFELWVMETELWVMEIANSNNFLVSKFIDCVSNLKTTTIGICNLKFKPQMA